MNADDTRPYWLADLTDPAGLEPGEEVAQPRGLLSDIADFLATTADLLRAVAIFLLVGMAFVVATRLGGQWLLNEAAPVLWGVDAGQVAP